MLIPKVGRTQPGLRITWWLLVAVLLIGILLHLFPFFYMISISVTPASEFLTSRLKLLPDAPTLAAWRLVFSVASDNVDISACNTCNQSLFLRYPYWVYLKNSLVMTFGALIVSLPVTSLAAYANSKLQRGPAARWAFLFFIGTLMVPEAVTLIPSFLLTRNFPFPLPTAPNIPGSDMAFPIIRIWDTPWAMIIPAVFNAFNFLLFKGFFDTIPDSIIQAARVDGGSEFNIFRRIVFPMSIPVYAVAGWLQFSAIWDSYLWPLVVFQSPEKIPTSVAITKLMDLFITAGSTDPDRLATATEAMREIMAMGLSWNGLMVLGLLQTLPIFIMFIVCREYLLRGIRLRGLK